MDFESPDVEKDFPGLYASESGKKSNESDFSDDTHEPRVSKKDLLIGKRKDKKDSKKDRGYATLEGESSPEEDSAADIRSPSKTKKCKPFKFPSKKEKREKSREKDKDNKDKDVEKEKDKKKDCDKEKDKEKDKDRKKEGKIKLKSSKDRRKLKHGEENCDIGEEQPVFGVPLSLALERSRCHDGIEIPLVVRDCIMHIEETGLTTEGVYKISGIKSKVQHIRRLYNQRESVKLSEYDLPVITSLLKLFLRELPECILTSKLSSKFEEASGIRDIAARGVELCSLMKLLPSCNVQLLSWIVKHLVSVATHEKQNKMSVQSISQILCQPLQISQRLLAALMCHADLLFPNTKLIKYIAPLTSTSSNLPETADEISVELRKQESLLGQIHSEMNAGYITKEREELLWEVQRMITQLKRKLKSLEKEAVETQPAESQPSQQDTIVVSQVSQGDDTISESVVKEHVPSTSTSGVISNSSAALSSSNIPPPPLPSDVINNTGSNCGSTKHIVEAVIENFRLVDEDKDDNDDLVDNNHHCNSDMTTSPIAVKNTDTETISASNDIDVNNKDTHSQQVSVDELALRLETEQLLALVAHLQSQLELEKSNIACLRSEISNLRGSPSFCSYLLESCSTDVDNNGGMMTMSGDQENSSAPDERNIAASAFLRQVKSESNVLQVQKKNLSRSIIDEHECITRLKVQVKLLLLLMNNNNNTCPVYDNVDISLMTNGTSSIIASSCALTSTSVAQNVAITGPSQDSLRTSVVSSPTIAVGSAQDK